MELSIEQLHRWMHDRENENLEFKTASESFSFDKLTSYCVALANEGGGYLVLGVSDGLPRTVVGTNAFRNLEEIKHNLYDRLHIRVDADELLHPGGRVLSFTVPARPIGMPLQDRGQYWMRSGSSLVPMTPDVLKRVFDEISHDFSAEICRKADISDLDVNAIGKFRQMWATKSGIESLLTTSIEQLLIDAELLVDGGITYAALILFGTRTALGRHLPQSEVIFEYRSSEASIPAQHRVEYREGFFLFDDRLWNTINLRNEVQQLREGLFMRDIATFNEDVIREAILNAVTHRDYQNQGSVFVRQLPRCIQITSPGGLPSGVTVQNILKKQAPRNRRIAENCARCGLVERSGQGVDKMYRESIKESKFVPDFTGTDDYQVCLKLPGDVQDPVFLRLMERINKTYYASFTTDDFVILDILHHDGRVVDDYLKERLPFLVKIGVIESVGHGRGTKYLLSRSLYNNINERDPDNRRRFLDREMSKELLLLHIRKSGADGCQLKELMQILPTLTKNQVQALLIELKGLEKVYMIGATKASRWYTSDIKTIT